MSAERRVWDCVCVFDEAAIEEVQSKKRGVYYFQRNSKEKRN